MLADCRNHWCVEEVAGYGTRKGVAASGRVLKQWQSRIAAVAAYGTNKKMERRGIHGSYLEGRDVYVEFEGKR